MKVYARLCPRDLTAEEREKFLALLDRQDEEGMEAFLEARPLESQMKRVIEILREARRLGERINVLDRTLPALPHTEISECYNRLRTLGNEIGDLEAAGVLQRA
jgi:ATP phosphoribosyltransferase regulatory subunit HisZ